MATVVVASPPERGSFANLLRDPRAWYWIAALIILGGCATEAATGHWLNQPSRDLYQHMAALRALIDNISNPSNPYVASSEGSRHFHPYWVAMAFMARTFGWTLNQTIAAASFLSMAIMAYGFWAFGNSYFRSRWGPLALLVATTLGWLLPISHTGFISITTFAEGASYPAQILNGLSLILWALVIGSLKRPMLCLVIAPLVGLMFATHQLGAGLGLIVGSFLVLFWPEGTIGARVLTLTSFAVGLGLSILWPYNNPFELLLRAGNPHWLNGPEWFAPKYYVSLLIPNALGIFGLLKPNVPGSGRPFLFALPIFILGYISADFGFQTGVRFAPIAVLMLQVGIAGILVRLFQAPEAYSDRFKLAMAGAAFGVILSQFILVGFFIYPQERLSDVDFGSVYASAEELTADIPDTQEVAAYDVAAWPITATGQKVLSIPWPEPMITDLEQRQGKVMRLFSSKLSRDERVRLAKTWGVRVLILDVRYHAAKSWSQRDLEILRQQSVSSRWAGSLMRFDLY